MNVPPDPVASPPPPVAGCWWLPTAGDVYGEQTLRLVTLSICATWWPVCVSIDGWCGVTGVIVGGVAPARSASGDELPPFHSAL